MHHQSESKTYNRLLLCYLFPPVKNAGSEGSNYTHRHKLKIADIATDKQKIADIAKDKLKTADIATDKLKIADIATDKLKHSSL